jgi:hypothetical protein
MDTPVSAIIYYYATVYNKCISSYEVTSKNKENKTTYYKEWIVQVPPTYDYPITELNYQTLWLVPVVAHAVFRTPDDGRKEHPKHVEESCSEINYRLLHAASCWKLIYIRLVMHGTMNVKWVKFQHLIFWPKGQRKPQIYTKKLELYETLSVSQSGFIISKDICSKTFSLFRIMS